MPGELIPITFFLSMAFAFVGYRITKVWERRIERDTKRIPPAVEQRLERMEQALDSIAVEVERISEGQRFTTKLLAERPRESLPAAGAEER